MKKIAKATSSEGSVKKPLSSEKLSTRSANKFWKKKANRSIEIPIAHAVTATEAHLRALSIINDDEDVNITFTPDMVRIDITKGGVA
jgi:hypothetical protein